MRKFRKLPVEIEAFQWTGDNFNEVIIFVPNFNYIEGTLEIWNELEDCYVNCPTNHWIIRGIKGELYPCEPEVFKQTYEPV